MATQRLTESDVHTACADIAAQGERPTALKLLDYLGRGSLTTISKYLNSWNQTDEAQEVDSLPSVVQLPDELTKDGEELIKKIWYIAKGLADRELDIQREALSQAEKDSQARVEEAFAFSEAQSIKIERLEALLEDVNEKLLVEENKHHKTTSELNKSEKTIVALTKDNEQYQHEINDLKTNVTVLEKQTKDVEQERKALDNSYATELKKRDVEIKSLDFQVHKLQTSLDSISKTHDQLKTDNKEALKKLSSTKVELEKLGVRYELVNTELVSIKEELKTANKTASDANKMTAKLEGQLEIYTKIDPR